MGPIKSVISCLCSDGTPPHQCTPVPTFPITEKPSPTSPPTASRARTEAEIISEIISLIRSAEKPGYTLATEIDDVVGTRGWTEWLAERVIYALEETLQQGQDVWGPALKRAYDDAVAATMEEFTELWEFVKEHPGEVAAGVLLTIVAFGVLVYLAPVVLEMVGFSELGPIKGSWSALWQARYAGRVPAGSLFSYFQRLGMTWKAI